MSVQGGFESIPLQVARGSTEPAGRQPITLAMRLAHRMTRHVRAKPRVLRNPVPLVSFTFDDVPASAAGEGARLLEEAGARGTFFVSTGLLGRHTPDWRLAGPEEVGRLAEAGHEIALHTHGHRPLADLSPRAFTSDLRQCAAALEMLVPGRVSPNFAFPFGFSHLAHHRCLNRTVRSSRTTHPGFNAGVADLQFLLSWPFGTCLDATGAIDRLLDENLSRGGWLIFTGHDVAARPSPYGCTPQLLAHALRGAARRGMRVEPLDRALDLCGIEPFVAEAAR